MSGSVFGTYTDRVDVNHGAGTDRTTDTAGAAMLMERRLRDFG